MQLRTHLYLLLICVLSLPASASNPHLAKVFEDAKSQGTLVLESLNSGKRYVHNPKRAHQPFTAASTFKVLHTLIALNEGVVKGIDSPIIWDGKQRGIPSWNRDQTLQSAFQVSCVWCYQQFAQQIDQSTYTRHLQQADYGQLSTPFSTTEFWLNGALQISADIR